MWQAREGPEDGLVSHHHGLAVLVPGMALHVPSEGLLTAEALVHASVGDACQFSLEDDEGRLHMPIVDIQPPLILLQPYDCSHHQWRATFMR